MASKNDLKVLIGSRVYTLSGYESEEYLQKIASYINQKITQLGDMPGYKRMSADMQKIFLELNIADDYQKARERIAELEEEIGEKDKAEYDLKHELITAQVQLEKMTQEIDTLKEQIAGLEKELAAAKN